MTAIATASAVTLTPAQKAAATKRALGTDKAAGLKAKITRLEALRDALTGYDRGLVTKDINASVRALNEMGFAI